ncbi:hypothetical protein Ciccas_003415 [Cichlidogyrus casuarinus]|uniref:Up-regulated during skeletal muscle growth protein 5 n=1 Tax=Cichlidogyrus casuarinus TaxID=1844966 RepID=A0ABD2QEG2_9PLAT
MGGETGPIPPEAIAGWRQYFNTYTVKGRANIMYTTYALVGLVAWRMTRPKKGQKAIKNK